MLLQKKRNTFDLNLLELPSGELELDLEKAQHIVTKELSDWMTGDATHRQGLHSSDTDHDKVYADENYFREKIADKKHPRTPS